MANSCLHRGGPDYCCCCLVDSIFLHGKLKRIEATLEFSKRFHDLIQEQRALNKEYDKKQEKDNPSDKADALVWWWRFFDLQLYEFDFYQSGYLREGRFIEWMTWRWYDHNAPGAKPLVVCGMDYKAGWEAWKSQPAHAHAHAHEHEHGNRLVAFLDDIHRADDPSQIASIVKKCGPRPWRMTGLSRDVAKRARL